MKKILFINGHLNTGGVERSLVDILKHMDYTKYAVDLLLLEDTGDYASELPPEVNVLFRDIHHTYGSFASSIRRCIVAHDWMCLRLRFLFLLRRMRIETCCNDSAWKTPLRLRNWISTGDLFRFGGVLRSGR